MTSLKEIFRTVKKHHSMHVAAGISLITTIIIFGVAYQEFRSYPDTLSAKVAVDVNHGIEKELSLLSKKAIIAVQDQFLANAVHDKDTQKLFSWIREELNKLGVDRIAVVDTEGFVLSRTAFGYLTGDNLFLTHPFGRLIASGIDYATSVEIGTRDPREVLFVSSAPIYVNGEKVGTLLLGDNADDAFTARFATSYIGSGARAAFYTETYGLFGSNIDNERSRELLSANIQAASDRLRELTRAAIFRTSDGQIYLVKDIPLQGIENQMTGLIVFVPILGFFIFVLVAALVPLIVFIVFCMILHHKSGRRATERIYYLAASVFGLSGMIITVVICIYVYNQIPKLVDTRYPLYNSILSLRPEIGVFDVNVGQKFSIVLDSGGEAINVVSIKLKYDPDLVTIESVDTAHSLCEYFLTDDYDKKGFIDLECGIPNPGFSGSDAVIADVYVKALHSGPIPFVFSDDSQVLVNDGLGTNVLRQTIGGTLTFEDRTTSASSTLSVFCGTHSNPERWYPNRVTSLSWAPRVPVLIETRMPDGSKTKQTFSAPPAQITLPSDGEYTFTVSPINVKTSKKSTIQARVDSTPPEFVSLEASEKLVKAGSIVRFAASAYDSGSGLQRTSYMKIDNDLFFPVGKEIHIPFPDAGTYKITLRAYDNAGNFKDSSVSIEVVN